MKNKRWLLLCVLSFALGAMTMFLFFEKASNDGALIRDMRLEKKQHPPLMELHLDDVVLKHIPLGTSASAAMEVCQKNGFQATRSEDMKGADYLGFEEYILCSLTKNLWYLIGHEEYRVIVYIKNKKVGAVIGRYFVHTL